MGENHQVIGNRPERFRSERDFFDERGLVKSFIERLSDGSDGSDEEVDCLIGLNSVKRNSG